MLDNYYGSLVYLCEASIALNYAYLEVIKRRKFQEINEKREKLVKQIENELPKRENEDELSDAVNRIKKKLKNLLSSKGTERFDAWEIDQCRFHKVNNQTKVTKCDAGYDSTQDCPQITPPAKGNTNPKDNLQIRKKCEAHKKYFFLPYYVRIVESKKDTIFAKYSIFIVTILLIGIIPLPDGVLEIPRLWWVVWFLLSGACVVPIILSIIIPDTIESGLEERIKTLEKEYRTLNLQEVEQTSSQMQESAQKIVSKNLSSSPS